MTLNRASFVLATAIAVGVLIGSGPSASASSASDNRPTAVNRCEEWEPLLRQYFPEDAIALMSRVMYRESRCLPDVIGWNYARGTTRHDCPTVDDWTVYRECPTIGSYDSGLLQINSTWKTVTRKICERTVEMGALLNPTCNVKVAAHLYYNGGAHHWKATIGGLDLPDDPPPTTSTTTTTTILALPGERIGAMSEAPRRSGFWRMLLQ